MYKLIIAEGVYHVSDKFLECNHYFIYWTWNMSYHFFKLRIIFCPHILFKLCYILLPKIVFFFSRLKENKEVYWSYVGHMIYQSCGLSVMWSISHVVYQSCDLSVTWSISHVIYQSCGLSVMWSVSHIIYQSCGLSVTWFISHVICQSHGSSVM